MSDTRNRDNAASALVTVCCETPLCFSLRIHFSCLGEVYLLINLYANPLLTATEGNLTSLGLKARHVALWPDIAPLSVADEHKKAPHGQVRGWVVIRLNV